MRTMVLRVVAEPQMMFWAPVVPAAGNLSLNVILMMFGIVLFDLNPLPFFGSTLAGHLFIVAYAARDPHLTTLIKAWSAAKDKTANIVKVKGNKYVA
jgi:hypothetical protein